MNLHLTVAKITELKYNLFSHYISSRFNLLGFFHEL